MNRVFYVPVRLGAQIHAWRWSRFCRILDFVSECFHFFLTTTIPRQAHAKRAKTRLQSSERGREGLTKNLKEQMHWKHSPIGILRQMYIGTEI